MIDNDKYLCNVGTVVTDGAVPSDLQQKLNHLSPGHTVKLDSGQYQGDFTLNASGAEQNPITILCDDAEFKNATVTLQGSHIRLVGGMWINSMVTVAGDFNRVTRCTFKDGMPGGNSSKLHCAISISGGASHNRIDHNEISDWQRRGIRHVDMTDRTKNNRIDHNLLYRFLSDKWGNSGEAIQIGVGDGHAQYVPRTIVEYNLIRSFNLEAEIISVKSQGNQILHNRFLDAERSNVSLRSCKDTLVAGNHLMDVKALIVLGDGHVLNGNRVDGGMISVRSGDCTFDQIVNPDKKYWGGHPVARDILLVGNFGRVELGKKARGKREYYHIKHWACSDIRYAEHDGQIKIVGKSENPTRMTNPGPTIKSEAPTFEDVGPKALDKRCMVTQPPAPYDWKADALSGISKIEIKATEILDLSQALTKMIKDV